MKVLFFVFLFFAGSVLADTYPASSVWHVDVITGLTAEAACASFGSAHGYYGAGVNQCGYTTNMCIYWTDSNNVGTCNYTKSGASESQSISCPNGGTLSGSNCINAPACLSPSIRSSSAPYACFTPVECAYPETDNGSHVCFNWTCPTGQNRNPVSKACQVPPACTSLQAYDLNTNTCFNKPLNCPSHTHANTANTTCLKDAPSACPAGQHDDGTWNCVADSIAPCTSNQVHGYINGIPQCINKTNAEQFAADAAAVHATELAAKAVADAAAAVLAADPTNTTKQDANTVAQGVLTSAKIADAAAQSNQDSAVLQSIDQTLKANQDRELGKIAGDLGQSCNTPPSCTGDSITCEQILVGFRASCVGDAATQVLADTALGGHTTLTENESTLASMDISGLGLGSSCPAPHSYTVLNAQMVIDLSVFCSIATIFGKLILITASFVSLRIVSS